MKCADRLFKDNVNLWTLIGPLAIMLSLVAVLLHPMTHSATLHLIAVVGTVLCGRWKTRGLIAALCLTSGWLLFQYKTVPHADRLWLIAITASLSLAFVIMALSLEEIQTKPQAAFTPSEPSEAVTLQNRCNQLQETLRIIQEEKNQLESQLKERQAANVELAAQHHALNEEKVLCSAKTIELDRSLRISEGMMRQLREQFEAKSAILDQTRQQLFHTEEALVQIKREWDEFLISNQPHDTSLSPFQTHSELVQEIDALHDLITTLLAQRSPNQTHQTS